MLAVSFAEVRPTMEAARQLSTASRCDHISSFTRRDGACDGQPVQAVTRCNSTRRSPSSRWRPSGELQRPWRRQGISAALTVDASAKRTAMSNNSGLRPTALMRTRRSSPCLPPRAHPHACLPLLRRAHICSPRRGRGYDERARSAVAGACWGDVQACHWLWGYL